MKYERKIEESREYEYGPGKEFETENKAKEHINQLKNKVFTNLVLERMGYSVEEMNVTKVKGKNALKLRAVIKYPTQIFES